MPSSKKSVGIFLFLLAVGWMPTAAMGVEDPARTPDIPLTATGSLLSSALEMEQTDMDCSHLVHYLYQRFGLDYDYANSISLYEGISAFRRVTRPQAGDLIVWRGHVGIVVDPEEQTFVSALRTGVKVASYVSRYWHRKGIPRFLHYAGTGEGIESATAE